MARLRLLRHPASLLVALVLLASCGDGGDDGAVRSAPEPTTSSPSQEAPRIGDHWHLAISLIDCGEELPPPSDAAGDRTGIHTHQDGLIHIHPFTTDVAGERAVLGAFFDTVGISADDTGLTTLDGRSLPFRGECDGAEASLHLRRWTSVADDRPVTTEITNAQELLEQPLRPDLGVLAIAFTDDPDAIELPSSAVNLEDPTAAEEGRDPVTDRAPSTERAPATGRYGAGSAGLAFAPVLAVQPPPCVGVALGDRSEASCYEVAEGIDPGIASAEATQTQAGNWVIAITLDEATIVQFDDLAAACFEQGGSCPTGQLAIVVDGTVLSAPTVQQRSFDGEVVIEGDFTREEANALADGMG